MFKRVRSELLRNPMLGVLLAILFVLTVLAVFPSLGTSVDPSLMSVQTLSAPSMQHILGTDELGRDVYAMMIYGTRVSMAIGATAACIAVFLGVVAGCLAGFYGGLLDRLLVAVSEFFQVMPTFIIAAVIVALSGAGVTQVVIVIALLAWPKIARVIRGEVMRVRELEYVSFLRCLGKGRLSILFFDILPNAVSPVIPLAVLVVGQAIMLEASLSFVGLNSIDTMTWGKLLNSGQRFIYNAWWLSIFPGLALLITILCFNLVGDAVIKHLDPRTQYDA
jgi:peptide/nickel transport system permease protein